jgi:hypothetical protein
VNVLTQLLVPAVWCLKKFCGRKLVKVQRPLPALIVNYSIVTSMAFHANVLLSKYNKKFYVV